MFFDWFVARFAGKKMYLFTCRWPSHIQVVSPAIRFIDYTPPTPDPLYEKTGHEPTPSVRGPQMGEVGQ